MTTVDAPTTRTEHDSLGAFEVPATAYWGVHTARALRNFPVSGTTVGSHRSLVAALGAVKLAAARANHELGLLDDRRHGAIAAAAVAIATFWSKIKTIIGRFRRGGQARSTTAGGPEHGGD